MLLYQALIQALTMPLLVQAYADRAAKAEQAKKAEPFVSSILNFFQTDSISRSSQTMARCVLAKRTDPLQHASQ